MIRLTINNGLANQTYYIGETTAAELLSDSLEEPIQINGLIKYLPQPEGDAIYERLLIDKYTNFMLSRANPEDVPGYEL